jgi:LacI family transcriptional regulator
MKKEFALITVKEIAKRCNVSPSTVSNIINGRTNVGEQTRQRVLHCVKETGYQPNYFAQSMRKQSSRVISIITEDLMTFGTNPIVEAIMAHCESSDYRTILMNLRVYRKWGNTWYDKSDKLLTEVRPVIQEALSIKADGIIYVAGHCRYINCFPETLPIPVVISYAISADDRFPSIVIDDEKGGYDIAKYLLSKGHEKIGDIDGAIDNLHTTQRLLGYQKALYEDGILFNPSWVFYGDWKRKSGYHGAKQLAGSPVTAFFCMNDEMAAGAYDYFFEQGTAIGRDISVIGYDNMDLSDYLRPRLTTNEIRLSEIGKKSAEIMIRTLNKTEEDENIPKTVKVPCSLIERGSVAAVS